MSYLNKKEKQMILDTLENISLYSKSLPWLKAMEFLNNLEPDCEDGEYEIEGKDVFARVMTYDTKKQEGALPEAHLKYIDIQVVLSGKELIFWNPLEELEIKTPYDEDSDVAFYGGDSSAFSKTLLSPGYFMAFFPEDAHMPSISINETPETVKKVVVKIAVDSIERQSL